MEGRIANFGIFLDLFEFCVLDDFFLFFKKIGFGGILGPPYYGIGATIRIGRDMLCLPYAGFLRYSLNVFLPPLPEVRCSKVLQVRNAWGKVMEGSGLRFENFY